LKPGGFKLWVNWMQLVQAPPRVLLGAKVLHDDLLYMPPVFSVRVAYGEQRIEALLPRLSYADENPRRERHPQLSGEVRGSYATRGEDAR
jgi:hypothetical protein